MTPNLTLRCLQIGRGYLQRDIIAKTREGSDLLTNLIQTRYAGHAKWQNIARTKLTNDQLKCQTISRYAQLTVKAVQSGGGPDPKLNGTLARVLAEAGKLNVPKATLDRAIARAMNRKIIYMNVEIRGPEGSAIIARCETDNPNELRRTLKKISKKFDALLSSSEKLMTMFYNRGYIRAAGKTKDQRPIDHEFAEEAAILCGAEEVTLEVMDAADEDLKNIWVFHTDADSMDRCRGELEKMSLNVLSSNLDLVPYNAVDYGEEIYEKIQEFLEALRECDQVVDVFHNALAPRGEDN